MSCHGLGPASQPKPKYEGMGSVVTNGVRGRGGAEGDGAATAAHKSDQQKRIELMRGYRAVRGGKCYFFNWQLKQMK
jgi:hypothetical protein